MQETKSHIRYYKPSRLDLTDPHDCGLESHGRALVDIQEIIWNGAYTKGELVQDFIDAIKERTGYEHVIATGSGTAALVLLARWYWKQGYRRILVPAFTWASTYKAFEWAGYRIAFVDINRETWVADFDSFDPEKGGLLGPELFVPVDTFGSVYPYDERFKLIDSAQSLGAKWDSAEPDRIVSLSGSKIITTGEGGLLLTQNEELYRFAMENDWFSRMPEMSAALGLAYVERLDDILEKKKKIATTYRERFPNLEWQNIPVDSNFYIVAALVDSTRDWEKANPNVEFRRYYSGIVSEIDEFVTYERAEASQSHLVLPNTGYVSRHILAFPSWPDLPLDAIESMEEP